MRVKNWITKWPALLKLELLGLGLGLGVLWFVFSLVYPLEIARQNWGWIGVGITFFIWLIPLFFCAAFIGSPGPATPEAKKSDRLGIIILIAGTAFIVVLASVVDFLIL